MRIDQIKQIIKIAECGSINKAARELYTSQSNISQSVHSLEEELGKAIFRRSGKGVELTKFGEEFLNYALATFDQYNLTLEFCKNYDKKEPPLKFSVTSQYIRFASLKFIEIYRKYASRDSEFSFLEGPLLEVLSNVNTHRAEIGLVIILRNTKKATVNLIKSRGLLYNSILACQPSIMVGKQNPLYNSELSTVTMEMLKDYPLVTFSDANFNFPTELLSQFGSNIRSDRIIVSDYFTLDEFLLSTKAYFIGVYTRAYEELAPHSNYRTLKLQDKRLSLEFGWVRSASRPLSDLGKEYIRMIEDSLKS